MSAYIEQLKHDLPNHIKKISLSLNKSIEKIATKKPYTNPYYAAIRLSNDLQNQLDTNLYIAKQLGVEIKKG